MKGDENVPVITIDGPSGSGKGTITTLLAQHLGWHMLDSGALYRAIAWAILDAGVSVTDEGSLEHFLEQTAIEIVPASSSHGFQVLCNAKNITDAIRTELCSMMASRVSALPVVRQALLKLQRGFRQSPGLIADGRDMGTVIFPDAPIKLYLDASTEVRAKRRFDQLQNKGIDVTLSDVKKALVERDARDASRAVSPNKPAIDAIVLDTSQLSVEAVMSQALGVIEKHLVS